MIIECDIKSIQIPEDRIQVEVDAEIFKKVLATLNSVNRKTPIFVYVHPNGSRIFLSTEVVLWAR